MKTKKLLLSFFVCTLFALVVNCTEKKVTSETPKEKRVTLEIRTTKGSMRVELYNETPKHRDNFVKLANEKVFDSLLFHRVIERFMVQTGDPYSKYANSTDTLGNGSRPYTVDAEFHPDLFHKRGVLGAARDGNPARASSSTQFYITQGEIQNDSLLAVAEGRINGWLAMHYASNDSINLGLLDAIKAASSNRDFKQYKTLNDSLKKLGKLNKNYSAYSIPQAHREVYKRVGGKPHLDQNYTVFGEVIEGLSVIDSIASVATNQLDRPLQDVRILSIRVVD